MKPFGWLLNRYWEVSNLFWKLSGAFGRFWNFKTGFYKALVQHGLQEAFWIDVGSIWGRAGEDLGNSWEDMGSHN